MKRLFHLLSLVIVASCSFNPSNVTEAIDRLPEIFPDYSGVTIPRNIAPLDFSLLEPSESSVLILESKDQRVTVEGPDFVIPASKWEALLSTGEDIEASVYARVSKEWTAFRPFLIHVSDDELDSYLVYRLIAPGYEAWNQMGIYQRCLKDYEQSRIIDNSSTGNNCMNCHSFAGRNPDKMLFHMRASNGGTYVLNNGEIEKLNTKTDRTVSALVYPQWDNTGRYVAFSVNDIFQCFHSTDANRVEVYDTKSDVVVYDVENHQIAFSPLTMDEGRFETFPTFSPDGKWLYFCSSKAVAEMPARFEDVKYSIVRIAFNPDDMTFGDELEMVYDAASEGYSASFPRISPDGRFLCFTRASYGNFSIWHKDADLWMMDLLTGECGPMEGVNSNDVESYHSWSGNSRWMVFSSRRDDGLYTKPYIVHIDACGKASKPFLLPQENPREYYDKLMVSFNIPEFVTGRVSAKEEDIIKVALESKGTDVSVREGL